MSRTVVLAAVQMDATPAPVTERLERAGQLATKAVTSGAQLVVLPELFNLGYAYSDENFHRAELLDGPTVAWMKATAARLNVHLAGSLLLLDQDEIYNALLLCAPDGRMWRYDKHYPCAWERAYFRESDRITVAHTDLGDIGMMLCWDIAHPDLWRRYAGHVDLMLVASAPPNIVDPVYTFPDGSRVTADEMGPFFGSIKDEGLKAFGPMFAQQVAWLGVPAVNTAASGQITTAIPNVLGTFASVLLLAPHLIKYTPQAQRMQATFKFVPACKVVDARGQVLGEVTQSQGESFTAAEVTLPDHKPSPHNPQPASLLSPAAYWIADTLLPGLSLATYRQGARRVWGKRMAPARPATQRWLLALGAVALINYCVGWLRGRQSAPRRRLRE